MELAFETQQEYTASAMSKQQPKSEHLEKALRRTTPTFLLELPLVVHEGQAKRLRAHLQAGRQFYNAVLSAGQKRLRRMRADPAWQEARALPRTQQQERKAAFAALREQYGFSEYAFHELARKLRVSFLADHLDAVLAQTLATRAYQALNRVCIGEARRVRFKSKGRGLSSIENKRNDTGLRFVLQKPEEGNAGHLIWQEDHLPARIDWEDEVVAYGLRHRIKYARLVQRRASSERAAGADQEAYRYFVQLALEGTPLQKPTHPVGHDTIGADLGPSTIALVPREGEASLSVFCEDLAPDEKEIRRLQRKMVRPIPTTTMPGVASRSRASNDCTGRRAGAMSGRAAEKPPKSASWPPIARVCMGVRSMQSWPWATPSSSKSFRIERGRNSMDAAWDCAPQGCL